MMSIPFVTVPEALNEFARGHMIVVVDDEDRENEGDLTLAAEFVTPEAINFMARFGRGLICLTLTEDRADHLGLGLMSQQNTSRFGTAFTTSIEAREGVTTGISARDRAHTIKVAIDPRSCAHDLARPGHVFPLRARKGGVLVRAGQTEASVDLARMAGLTHAGVICEIMNDDGTMARVPDLIQICRRHGLKMLSVAELIRYRLQNERSVHRIAQATIRTQFAEFRAVTFESDLDQGDLHTALVLGEVQTADPVLVRIQSQCLAGDVFENLDCNCRRAMQQSLRTISDAGCGVLVYLNHTGQRFGACGASNIGATASCSNTDDPHQTPDGTRKTMRQVGLGSQILHDLGVRKIRLLTNTKAHVPALQGFNLQIVERVHLSMSGNLDYLSSIPSEDAVFGTL